MKALFAKLWILGVAALLVTSVEAAGRNVAEYNLKAGVGFKGYDPVATFPEGGAKPTKGLTEFRVVHEGVTYFFASQANLELFEANPAKYEPTYGGYCAWAMFYGDKVDIKPELYTLRGNRAHYFISARAKRNFDADVVKHEAGADVNWRKFSGEEPRL